MHHTFQVRPQSTMCSPANLPNSPVSITASRNLVAAAAAVCLNKHRTGVGDSCPLRPSLCIASRRCFSMTTASCRTVKVLRPDLLMIPTIPVGNDIIAAPFLELYQSCWNPSQSPVQMDLCNILRLRQGPSPQTVLLHEC